MKTATSIRFWTTVHWVALSVVMVMVIILAILAWTSNRALCAFNGDLAQRAANTQKLLDDAPPSSEFIHAYGLTIRRDQLQSTLDNQRATLDALDDNLFCSISTNP